MSKWIAEFELEDGDKMPEHMDLEYHGVKLDFHCRPIGKTYEDGLNEAWEAARKVLCESGCNLVKLEDIFERHTLDGILNTYTASEVIERFKKYERFNVGDEVVDSIGKKSVVVRVYGEYITVVEDDGTAIRWEKENFKKTGRHFSQIEEVLKQMQESEE